MEQREKIRNYDLLSDYSYFIPNPTELFAIALFFLGGALLGSIVATAFVLLMPGATQDVVNLISYPIMFFPPMIYAKVRSRNNAMFDSGRNIDASHFGKPGFLGCAGLSMLAVLALAFLMDIVNAQMPEMPEWLEEALKSMTQGHFWVNFICVSIFAPFFEEWLCRGMVLRGLLNYKRRSKKGANAAADAQSSEVKTGISPEWAIIISALFFAIIHMNPWQAIPAFGCGCLFGYVYYRTGSLKLTMLMHFTNNTLALILANMDSVKDADTWFEIMPLWQYCCIAAVCLAFLVWFVKCLNKIELVSGQGNNDEVKVYD